MKAAKLSFAAHASAIHCIDAINHTPELQSILDGITDPIFRESVRDIGINQAFRRDLFVRGPRKLSRQAHAAGLLDTSYALAVPRSLCSMKVRTTIGEAQLQQEIYAPVLDRLDEGAQTGRQLSELAAIKGAGGLQRLMQVLIVLVGAGYVQPCASASQREAAGDAVKRFNRVVLARAARGDDADLPFLASAVLGSGVSMPRLHQLFLVATSEIPDSKPMEQVAAVWNTLRATRQTLMKDGKVIEGDQENQQELATRLEDWKAASAPIHRRLCM